MASVKPPGSNKKTDTDTLDYSSSGREEAAEGRNCSSRQRIRDKMQSDIDAFLAKGGRIEELDIGMSAEKLSQQAGEASH